MIVIVDSVVKVMIIYMYYNKLVNPQYYTGTVNITSLVSITEKTIFVTSQILILMINFPTI